MSEANESSTVTDDVVAEEAEPSKPLLRVVKGDLTPEELAALVAVVASTQSAPAAPPKQRSEWGHPARAVRGPHRPAPDAWRRSAWA